MEIVVKIITLIGGLTTLSGLFWMLGGAYEFFQGRKNRDRNRQDDGQESLTNGFGLTLVAGGITTAIITAIRAIQF